MVFFLLPRSPKAVGDLRLLVRINQAVACDGQKRALGTKLRSDLRLYITFAVETVADRLTFSLARNRFARRSHQSVGIKRNHSEEPE